MSDVYDITKMINGYIERTEYYYRDKFDDELIALTIHLKKVSTKADF